MRWSLFGSLGLDQSYWRYLVSRTAIRSAADIEEVGWPEPAAVLQRIESTRSCWPSWRAKSRSVVVTVSVTAMSLPRTAVRNELLGGLEIKFIERSKDARLRRPSDRGSAGPRPRNRGR